MSEDKAKLNDCAEDAFVTLARRAVACKHWHWRIGMAGIAANDLARLFTRNCDLPIRGESGVRLISPVYSEARYAFCEHLGVQRAHEKAYVAMLTESEEHDWCGLKDDDSQVGVIHLHGENADDCSNLWAVGFTHLVNLIPDFHDTVTAKGLLQVVRAAWPDEYRIIAPEKPLNRWLIDLPNRKVASGDTEVEALIVALEMAP